MFEARNTLQQASQAVFGRDEIPYFDLGRAEVILSFGANFTETWLSPVAYNLAYGEMRRGNPDRRGILVHLESRMSQTAANADLWIPIRPGTEGLAAAGIGKLTAEILDVKVSSAYQRLDMEEVVTQTGISREKLREIASLYAGAERKTAVPGGAALGVESGYESAVHILSLNLMQDDLLAGGVSFVPEAPLDNEAAGHMADLVEIQDLVARMEQGQVSTLLVHGVDPVFELPPELGFAEALEQVNHVVSFHSYPTDTALRSDLILPDHTPLEAWGYQRKIVASDRMTVSGSQPVVAPLYDTRAVIDVLLSALEQIGGEIREQLAYRDEVDFLQKKVAPLMDEEGAFTAPVIEGFWSKFLQHGGWWAAEPGLEAGDLFAGNLAELEVPEPVFSLVERGLNEYYFLPYPIGKLGDGRGANRPWLQETPDSMTTVMWRSWVEINPSTAEQLGIANDDVVEIITPAGSVLAAVYLFPGIRPDTIAFPYGYGHQGLGRFADDSGQNPLKILPAQMNRVGDAAFASSLVSIRGTGDQQILSRFESREGVYGSKEH
jgi:anaerobic selenocysteine-containing dehydrogenase